MKNEFLKSKILFLRQRLSNNQRQAIKFLFSGGSMASFDLILTMFFKEILHLKPVTSVAIGQIIIVSINFYLNRTFVFRAKGALIGQTSRYLILLLTNYLSGILFMFVFNQILKFDYRLVRISTIAIMATFNFFVYKHWVYRQEP